ncbi:hypothetical protein [Marinococcus halophilus]|uniref:hypothetical protein n=1 Tax=Marinococcus halophilus TaxID=1371 RepID=UPI0009A8601C|nr:hypothetical protein [Marinococcus halophilus]
MRMQFELAKNDREMLQEFIQTAIKTEVREAMRQMQLESQMPEVMTRRDLMNFLGINANRASELLNHREGFPVSREIGESTPRIHRDQLIEWLFPKDEQKREERAQEFDIAKWDRIS